MRLLQQLLLGAGCQFTGNNLTVYGIGNAQRFAALLGYKPHVLDIKDVLVAHLLFVGFLIVGQYRLNDALHTRLLQFVDEDVDVGIAAIDNLLLGTVNHFRSDDYRAVAVLLHFHRHLVAQRIYQPGLAFGSIPNHRKAGLVELLTRGFGMFHIQGVYLFLGKIAQPQ